MKFPLFQREKTTAAQLEAQAQVEKLLAESLRTLGKLFSKLAETLDAQRLERKGYREQGGFLERLDVPKDDRK